jgi:hypothetical protein
LIVKQMADDDCETEQSYGRSLLGRLGGDGGEDIQTRHLRIASACLPTGDAALIASDVSKVGGEGAQSQSDNSERQRRRLNKRAARRLSRGLGVRLGRDREDESAGHARGKQGEIGPICFLQQLTPLALSLPVLSRVGLEAGPYGRGLQDCREFRTPAPN